MKFKRIKIIEAGPTANTWTEGKKTGVLVITVGSLPSLAAVGNLRAVHARKTHNGADLLDGYLGSFTDFIVSGNAVYADFTISPSLEKAYPEEATFLKSMIQKEPEMLGISVVDYDVKKWNAKDQTFDVIEFKELISCDFVGLPAATTSLFSRSRSTNNLNNNQMSKKKNVFASIFSSFAKTKLSEHIVSTADGSEITIRSAGDEVAVGDEVVDSEGNPLADGEYTVTVPENGELIIIVEDGVITGFREAEEAPVESEIPEEFATRLDAIEQSLASITTMLSKQTKTPPAPNRKAVVQKAGATKLSVEQRKQEFKAEMAKQFPKK